MAEFGLAAMGAGAGGALMLGPAGAALVNRIADAVGWIAAPAQVKRLAKAEVVAARLRAEAELEIADLVERTGRRILAEETTRQRNMENVIGKAVPLLHADAAPEDLETDWIVNFFDKCRTVADDRMQDLWAAILAGEANNPGILSRKTVNVLADLDAVAANLFEDYLAFSIQLNGSYTPPIILESGGRDLPDIYVQHGITLNSIRLLADLGLASTGFDTSMALLMHHLMTGLPATVKLAYGSDSVELRCPNGHINTGITTLTPAGLELSRVCLPSAPVPGFFNFVCAQWNTMCQKSTPIGRRGATIAFTAENGAFGEAAEDAGLAQAMEAVRNSERIDRQEIMEVLEELRERDEA